MTVSNPDFIKMRDELIRVCSDACSVWEGIQGQEFANEHGWLKADEQEKYYTEKTLYDNSLEIYNILRVDIKTMFPEEVKSFAKEQYDILTTLIKDTPKDDPNYDPEWRDLRRNWSALLKGKKTPYNEFWAWGSAFT